MGNGELQPQMETIRYDYPDMGSVEIRLHKESAEIYRWIKSTRDGIEHFERLDQLGALRAVHRSAHHSRWEYMVFQMYLVQELGSNSAFGISTSIPLTQKYKVSSVEELIKCWVLLHNYGHLLDTFEAERVWFELMLENKKLYSTFVHCMPDQTCKNYLAKIKESQDLYSFHYLIAVAFLMRMREKRSKYEDNFDLWIEMLKALLGNNTTESTKSREGTKRIKLERALNIFHTIRHISYVLLDINRSTLFLRIDSNNLIRNILKNPDAALYDPESDIRRTLEDIEHLLFSEVYANKEACSFKYKYIKDQMAKFNQIINKNGIESICKDRKIFVEYLYQKRVNNFGKYRTKQTTKHLFRMNLLPIYPFERMPCRFHDEQQNLKAKVGNDVEFLITPTSYREIGSIVDVFTTGQLDAEKLSNVYYVLAKYILECYEKRLHEWGLIGHAASKALQELFTHIVKSFIDSSLNLRFPTGSNPADYDYPIEILEKSKRKEWSRDFLKSVDEDKLDESRKWELKSLGNTLRRKEGELSLISLSNIHNL